MHLGSHSAAAAIVATLLALCGCQSLGRPAPDATSASLTSIAAELQMHLRDDTYRSHGHVDAQGRNAFEIALWRLDRLQRDRAVPFGEWTNVDLVIEFARARALERLRRYDAAADAYERVAATGSLLAEPAVAASPFLRRLGAETGAPGVDPDAGFDAELTALDQRVAAWDALAWELRDTSYEPLAQEEAEAWAVVRVDALARHRGLEAALEACAQLIERHRHSKRYAEHLIRLGDLYAEAARRDRQRWRAERAGFDPARHDRHLDRALAAYELAGEDRTPALRSQARKKIEALLAAPGVNAHVP